MSNWETDVSRQYVDAVLRRKAHPADNPVVPADHVVDWEDRPSAFKTYRGVHRISLKYSLAKLRHVSEIMGSRSRSHGSSSLTYEVLSSLMLLSNGILKRKLGISWSLDDSPRADHVNAVYGRSAASGGGLYPVEFYFASGNGGWLLPGLYHYDGAHHALEQLSLGDMTACVRYACFGCEAAVEATEFVLVSLNFWKSSFKYHNFAYHVATQDLGAGLGAMRFAASALSIDLTFLFWFHDEALNGLLGFETREESVFVVGAIGRRGSESGP
ncbi:MAG TPA: SagB family peptide dehydrogenase, partial [Blastocatellia bacterium]|nr:SagB family peptide dehydrogenase [Blastocatellia bacterium]